MLIYYYQYSRATMSPVGPVSSSKGIVDVDISELG